jgi:CVNH domain
LSASNVREIDMKGFGGAAAVLALVGMGFAASAQGLPPGSYQRSCSAVRVEGAMISATCRRDDGRVQQSALDISHCAGDIENRNGRLKCNAFPAAPYPARPPGYAGPGFAAPGYPPSGGYPPHYGEGQDYRKHCERLQHEAHELYERLQRTPYGEDRERLEHRLRDVNYERERCPHH